MGTAHSGFDDKAFYEADIAETRTLTPVDATGTQTADADGPLAPGRYRIIAIGLGAAEVCWIQVGAFEKGSALTLAAGAGVKKVPLTAGAPEVYTHVRKDDSDRIGAIMGGAPAGTVTVYISRMSTRSK